MATRATVRARVRRELGDTQAVQLWSDAQINDHFGDAVRELSYVLTRDVATVTLATVADQREYALGVAVTAVVGVECPLGTLLPPATGAVGVPAEGTPDMPASGAANDWTANVQAGTVRLRVAPAAGAGPLRISYRPLLAAPADDTTALAVAPDEEAIVALLTCRSLWELRRVEDGKRGLRPPDGNPFADRLNAMLARRRRVRVGSLAGG